MTHIWNDLIIIIFISFQLREKPISFMSAWFFIGLVLAHLCIVAV